MNQRKPWPQKTNYKPTSKARQEKANSTSRAFIKSEKRDYAIK